MKVLDKKVIVVGTGYVGLPAALMLAQAGFKVVGVDINENIVRALNEGVLLIGEDELRPLLDDPVVRGNLSASTSVEPGDVYLLAVPTPLHARKKVADLTFVISALEEVMPHLKAGDLIMLESTVPPLTCRELLAPMIERSTGLAVPDQVMLAHCPERILPGSVFHEIVHNDRIIGGMDRASTDAASEVYATFVTGELLRTDDVTAELCKLMENTHRDVNIALSNEMAEVAETLGVKWEQAFALANRHPRVSFLRPGIGVGGHCIPIDPWFIKEVDPVDTRLIEVARRVNDAQPARVAAKLRQAVAAVSNPVIIAVGAAYKPNTEDCRESPANEVVALLRHDGYQVRHFDPLVPGMGYASLEQAVEGGDLLVVLVGHDCVLAELSERREAIELALRQPLIIQY